MRRTLLALTLALAGLLPALPARALVNQEAIDQAAEALMAQGELVGDEVGALLSSVTLRMPAESDPYPEELPMIPPSEAERGLRALETA